MAEELGEEGEERDWEGGETPSILLGSTLHPLGAVPRSCPLGAVRPSMP